MEIAIVLGLLALTVALFAVEWLSVDLVTLIMLIALVATGILTPSEAFAGFATDIVVVLASIFVLSGALERNGVMDAVGAALHAAAGRSELRMLVAVMALAAAVSAFMNNTTATAVFVPTVVAAARRAGVSPSKLLIPLAHASILGGTCTVIGTSTNVAVSGAIERMGLPPVGLFEILPVGLAAVGVGLAYTVALGRRLLPDHREERLTEEYGIGGYLSEIVVPANSPIIGERVFGSDLSKLDLRVIRILRGERTLIPDPRTRFLGGDVLVIEGPRENLLRVKETAGIEIRPEVKLGDLERPREDVRVAETLLPPQSGLAGRTLEESRFRETYGLTVLAIYRHGQSLHDRLAEVRLAAGDLLLVQGSPERLSSLRRHHDLWLLEEVAPALFRTRKGVAMVALFAGAVLATALGLAPLSVCFLGAAVLAVALRAIAAHDAYEFIDWRLIIMIGGMTAFGTALEKTGAAQFLANGIVGALAPAGPVVILAGFFVLVVLLTQPMSNAAAALVVLPVAMRAAEALGADPRSFAIGIMIAASVSFVTPFEPACILVYGPGKYRFRDFLKTGLPLTVILLAVALVLVPALWPLRAGG